MLGAERTLQPQLTTARGLFGLGLPELALVGGAAVLLFGGAWGWL